MLALCALLLSAAGRETPGEDELQRTWDAAWIYVPAKTAAGYRKLTAVELSSTLTSSSPRAPAVILYAHGCDGLSDISAATSRFLAQAGYLVVAPDSFARREKPVSCDPSQHRGGLHRAVLGWRQAEMHYAFQRLRMLPGLQRVPVVLMGHSEGAITAATIRDLPVSGRIIEGWTCHAGWPEYRGLDTPPGQPVLALVGANDPWFRAPALRGDCGLFMQDGGRQRSIVYSPPNPLSSRHWLSFDPGVQQTILAFIEGIAKPFQGPATEYQATPGTHP
jgi:dienelactone hydrolase